MAIKVQAIYTPDLSTTCELPVFVARVQAGFPSPADDYIEGKLVLLPDNDKYQPMEVNGEAAFEVWGVVTHVIHKL